ncbi:reverse transcriptase domain-containing protein [Serratia marcescens]|uniref:reverse transcriptase domain-containing protein n=1 Tax=Serratia marcescens TaxID=615 RepID=UPI0027E49C54|nr:reverse transcriptase domain-containing protein [Serratia marcescens]MDH2267919.1 reverse transcriptase domain-containing protein [Serratia marcescens]MDH2275896.1 reverse transcriptase domain-containing protein [Serratia marcescens]
MKHKITKISSDFYKNFYLRETFTDDIIMTHGVPNITNSEYQNISFNNRVFFSIKQNSPHKKIQERIIRNFLQKVPLSSPAIAYRKKLSYLHFLEPHIYGENFCRIDLCNFFHNINYDYARECFKSYFEDEYLVNKKIKVVDAFLNSLSVEVELNDKKKRIFPMGFSTSPFISNIIFRKLDILIKNLCDKRSIMYTRYADDMLFSSSGKDNLLGSEHFDKEISSIVNIAGLNLNVHKKIFKRGIVSLNGYVIENKDGGGERGSLRISNGKTYLIRKALDKYKKGYSKEHICQKVFSVKPPSVKYKNNADQFVMKFYNSQFHNKLAGYRSYLISLVKFNEKFGCFHEKEITKYSAIIDEISSVLLKS